MGKDMDRCGHWLSRGRVRLYSFLMFGSFLMFSIGFVRYSNLVETNSYTAITDFTVFWSVSHLALMGHASDAYEVSRLDEIVRMVAPDEVGKSPHGWFYPPNFFLTILPLGLLSYFQAYLVFMLATLSGYVLVLQRIIRGGDALWCLAGFSGVWINLLFSQNGFLTAALAGAALLNLERRPVLAGVFIGLLSIKPHLVLLFPVALIVIAAWRTLFTAVFVAIVFIVASTSVLGADTFLAWLHSLGLARKLMETDAGRAYWSNMPTMFAFLRLLDVPVMVSYMGHAVVALTAVATLWKVWLSDSRPLRGAAFTTATLLVSPYLMVYDLTWLALPIAWLTKLGLENGWLRGEREVLVAASLLPLLLILVAKVVPLQIGPWVLLALLWVVLRRARMMARHGVEGNGLKFPP